MSRLTGGILPGYGDHRREPWRSFARYCRAIQTRYGLQAPDALPWVREAGLLTVALDQLHQEVADTRAVLTNGSGRRARDKARATLRQLERRAARLRGSLENAEARLEALAGQRPGLDLARAIQQAQERRA